MKRELHIGLSIVFGFGYFLLLLKGEGMIAVFYMPIFVLIIGFVLMDISIKNNSLKRDSIILLVVLAGSIYSTVPHYLDMRDFENNQYEKQEIAIKSVEIHPKFGDSIYSLENERFSSDCRCRIEEGKSYQISYLPRTKSIFEAVEIRRDTNEEMGSEI